MGSSAWHPRIVPFFVYIVLLSVMMVLPDALAPAQPALYVLQCGLVVWLMWRYRKLTPELTASFHWLAIPTGVFLVVAWIVLGYAMNGELPWRWSQAAGGDWSAALGAYPYADLGVEPNMFGPDLDAEQQIITHPIQDLTATHPMLGQASLWLRLLGMSLVVPFFEEMFIRSAMLRGLHKPTRNEHGELEFVSERQLKATPVGKLTGFAVAASTIVFMLSHGFRDWPGCIACGLVWCGLVWWTNKPRPHKGETWASIAESTGGRGRYGLGPIIWSHGITNALLWLYTVMYGDWQFL